MSTEAVIFDIDGTLAVTSPERLELIRTKSWDRYHQLSICAKVNVATYAALLDYQKQGKLIVLITARPKKWSDLTIHWLEKNNIPFDALFMRKDGDRRHSYISKQEHLGQLKFLDILEAWDDRDQDIEMYKTHGIKTIKVNGEADESKNSKEKAEKE